MGKRQGTGKQLRRAASLVWLLLASPAFSQTPYLVKDINKSGAETNRTDGLNGNLAAIGNTVFFAAFHPSVGAELWKSDGTSAGTGLVRDIWSGISWSFPSHLTAAGGSVFFTANDGTGAPQVWKSDGTAAGTIPLTQFTGLGAYNLESRAVLNGRFFFVVSGQGQGVSSIWKSDGTASGTMMLNPSILFAASLTASNNQLFFIGSDTQNSGPELWKSDGTGPGTTKVSDLPGTVSMLTDVGGTLYFRGPQGELWRSDGTAAGTSMLWASGVIDATVAMIGMNGALYFTAYTGGSGSELWRSDGTGPGTALVKDIFPGSSSSRPESLTRVGGNLFFAAREAANGLGLWRSDGTEAGTLRLKDGGPGAVLNPYFLTAVGSSLFFAAYDTSAGAELWTSNGTPAGTVRVKDIRPGIDTSDPGSLLDVNGTLFFRAYDGTTSRQLWRSDGTAGGTVAVKNIYDGSAGSSPEFLTNLNGILLFSANDQTHGAELWRSDGTLQGTSLVRDILEGSQGSSPSQLTSLDGTLFFTTMRSHPELWKSDGSGAGTVLLREFADPPGYLPDPRFLTRSGGRVLFSGFDTVHGRELWASDGTTVGTAMVTDIRSGSSDSEPRNLTNVNGTLFFTASDGVTGVELWRTDGTPAGTVLVKDIAPGSLDSAPDALTAVGSVLYFAADDGVHGSELWLSDGTEAGTVMVKDLENGSVGSRPSSFKLFGNLAFFAAWDSSNGEELWKTDGTAAGTGLVKAIEDGPTGSSPRDLTEANGGLFFRANYGGALWKTDGTEAGTVRVYDRPTYFLASVNGTLYFTADNTDSEHFGPELWKTDGTPGGAVRVNDVRYPFLGSSPHYLTSVGGRLFFAAGDGTLGDELWTLDTSGPTVTSLVAIADTTTADVSADVPSDGGSTITERGFLYSTTNATPTDGGADVTKAGMTGTTGAMAATLSGMSPNTPYFLRAFARNGQSVGYEATTFVTAEATGPAVRVTDATVVEGDTGITTAVFTVMLSTPSDRIATVDFATADQTAVAGSDYASTSGTLTFAPGSVSQSVRVPVFGDTDTEPDETFALSLSAPNGLQIADGEGIGQIKADDGHRLTIGDRSVREGDSGSRSASLLVTLSPAASSQVTVDYSTADDAAIAPSDYEATSGVLVFAPGETQKSITARINGDSDPEPNESFRVVLSNATGVAIVAHDSGQVLIRDDDGATLRSRLLFHNTSTNRLFRWHMTDGTRLDSYSWVTPWATDPGWSVGTVADFDADGQLDLLWHNQDDGRLLFWYLDGDGLKGFQFLPYRMLPPWRVAATFDSDGSGRRDIVYQNETSGAVRVVQQDNATVIAIYDLANTVDAPWRVAAGADIVRGGADMDEELLIQNPTTGQLLWWNVTGSTLTSGGFCAETQISDPEYLLVSAETDFNGDNLPDLLWHNPSPSGVFSVWFMDGTTRVGTGTFTPYSATDPVWRVVGSANIW